ncbi:DUF47 family protein [Enterocloster asparagiformis]|uniref:DUF47 domain-containing protein n=1 Tax=Enterocloster asparagiformis TaxID=333367 RepID=UPI002A834C8E|nr:DUF47 family protein [Enterocloster asparagiformis]
MAKKSDNYYFENFIQCVECGCQAAMMLEENLANFDVNRLSENLDELHKIEHDADKKKHEMMGVLVKAFITPIEREDIILLSQCIDEVTDQIEDVLIRIYINNVHTIRPEALQFTKVIIRCCKVLKEIMEEFANFKKSKTLHGLIIEINALEEEGDRLFIDSMRRLHTEVADPLEIIAWREIYNFLEKCCDACEHVADAVESVIMKNT